MPGRWSRSAKIAACAAVVSAGGACAAACNALLDVGAYTFGACDNAGDRRCVGNALQECSTNGVWTGGVTCEGMACDADAGGCVGVCAPGAVRCAPDGGAGVETCDPTGQWTGTAVCAHACFDSACTTCTPGQASCTSSLPASPAPTGDTLIVCSPQGVWAPLDTPSGCNCVNGACRACTPGSTGCQGVLLTTCTDAGYWPDAGGACPGGEVCDPSERQCAPACTAPSSRCWADGGQVQSCNDAGQWDVTAECDPTCSPCDPTEVACKLTVGTPCVANCVTDGRCGDAGACDPVDGGAVACVDVGDGGCYAPTCDDTTGRCSVPDDAGCSTGDPCSSEVLCAGGVCAASAAMPPVPTDDSFGHWIFADVPATAAQRFLDTKQVVYDVGTHLMWQRAPYAAALTNTDAKAYCNCLRASVWNPSVCTTPTFTVAATDLVPGYPEGWRLPTRIELASIVAYPQAGTGDLLFAPFAPSASGEATYWSGSADVMAAGSQAWTVSFAKGSVAPLAVNSTAAVRCVR